MSTVSIIRSLAATSSRTEKENILKQAWLDGERNLFTGAKLAYDILVTFGVKQVAEIQGEDDDQDGTFTFDDFLALAEKLRKRELTGNAARDVIHEAAGNSNTSLWNEFYRRVLLKDLRIGATEGTFNKVLKEIAKKDADAQNYIVPVFSCQLAKDGVDEVNAKKIKGIKQIDIKLDGTRLLTVVDIESRTVTQYTRNGKQNDNFTNVRNAFEPLFDNLPCSMVFDGEITSKSFQTLMQQVNRKYGVDTSDAKLALFDMVPLEDFRSGECKMSQKDRHTALCGVIAMLLSLSGEVYVVPKLTVNLDTPEGQETFKEFNREALEAGYEGIMVKDPESTYRTKRTDAWLKIKPFITVDLEVISLEEGTGKYTGMLGALMCKGVDQDREIVVNVGSGLSDEQRKDFWENANTVKGQIVEIKADAISKSDAEEFYSLRFPRFERFRSTTMTKGEKD